MAWKIVYSELQTTHIIVHRGLFVYNRVRSSLAPNSHFAVERVRVSWQECMSIALAML